MAELVDARPGLDPDSLFDGLPSDLWGALVLQVIGQQLSLAAAAAILARLEALHGGRMLRTLEDDAARPHSPRSRESAASPLTEC
jgi:DNA-3-methyladenine glycosylase II